MSGLSFNVWLREIVNRVGYDKELKDCHSLLGYAITDETAELLKKISHLMMETNFTREDTKQYLSTKTSSFRQVYLIDGCSKNTSTTATRKMQDIDKLKRILSEDFFTELICNRNIDVLRYMDKVQNLIEQQNNKSLLDSLVIKYPKTDNVCRELDNQDRETLLRIARFQSKKGRSLDESKLTSKIVAYVNFLENNKDSLQDDDLEVYTALYEWLG